ncbi:MAG TPA: ABC-ATPase domain-containing protein [Candidatus Sulfomarinibacteraceae bacterium]|nr:ABC-ATPase domain-containing protein [Candidatus Sulfomarinibacteraceae bacterium]
MASRKDLIQKLHQIDGRGYKAYKSVAGRYEYPIFTLFIDYVQGDPYASPSRLRVRVPQQRAAYPSQTYDNRSRRVGLESYLAIAFDHACRDESARRGSGKSGLIAIDAPGQQLIERNALNVTPEYVEARFVMGLPARGRKVLGHQAAEMLGDALPHIVAQSLFYENNDAPLLQRYVETNEDADALRAQLADRNLIAFIADGSILPRRSGIDDRPLSGSHVVPFQSPESLRVSFDLPNVGRVGGMGLPAGVTLIVGGGFHGKSTLLNALERGVYNHRPGDGRERVVTDHTAVKIRAEDGRRVAGVDISPFIDNLPFGQDTRAFSSDNASGSTSQAANIVEALAQGAQALLIDEDTAATNFMIRDRRMQALIAREKEPITPFIDRVQQLHRQRGVSTILVIGGSGDYFDVADHVIAMDTYVPRDVTQEAHAIGGDRQAEGGDTFGDIRARAPIPGSIDPSKGRRRVRVRTHGCHTIQFGTETIDLSAVEQLVDGSQTRAIAEALVHAWDHYIDGQCTVAQVIDRIMADVENEGLDTLSPFLRGDLAVFRPFELAAALNRLRTLEVE